MKELKELLKNSSVEEVAKKLGVNPSTVYFWKAGTTKPSRLAKEKILRFLSEQKLAVSLGR